MDRTLLLLPVAYRPEAVVGFALPGLGAVFALAVLLVTGVLVTNLIGRSLVVWGEDLLNRIPVVRSVYGGVKSFAESVFSQSNSFRKVVMIEYPRVGVWSVGFMTAEDVPEVLRANGRAPRVRLPVGCAECHRGLPRGGAEAGGGRARNVRGCGDEDDHHLRGGGAARAGREGAEVAGVGHLRPVGMRDACPGWPRGSRGTAIIHC